MRALLAGMVLLTPPALHAGESAAFLKIPVGVRAIGMGGAFAGVSDDVSALHWNPAGLSVLSQREFGASHAELPAQARYEFIGYAQRALQGVLGVGAAYLSHAPIEGRDAAGKPTGSFRAADSLVQLAYAARAGETHFGGAVKHVRSTLADTSAQSFALDAGALREFGALGPGRPRLGFAVQNIGPGLRYLDERNPLPLTLAGGMGYRLPVGILLALDVRHRPHSKTTEVAFGTEYVFLSHFAIRAGYGSDRAAVHQTGGFAALKGLAAGLGLTSRGYSLDYSFTPFGELGQVQRFSLGARF